MSFTNRLTLFFLVIVVLPMGATAALLIRSSGQLQNGQTDAGLIQGLKTASHVYDDLQQRGVHRARQLSDKPGLKHAWQQGAPSLERFLKQLVTDDVFSTISIYGSDGHLIWKDGSGGLASIRLQYGDGKQKPTIVLASLSPAEFVTAAKQLTGEEIILSRGDKVISSTLNAATPPTDGDVTVDGMDYRARHAYLDLQNGRLKVSALTIPSSTDPLNSQPFLAVVFLALLVLAVFLAYVLRRSMQGQIQGMVDAAKQIGQGDFSVQVPASGKDEMSQLATEFNRMSVLLKQRERDIREHRAELEQSIHRIGEAIASGLDREALLEITINVVGEACHAEHARMTFFNDSETKTFDDDQPDPETIPLFDTLLSTEFSKEPTARAEVGLWRGLAKPIYSNQDERVEGVIMLARRGRAFNQAEEDLLGYLSSQTTISLENLSLHEIVSRQAVTDGLTSINNRRSFDQLLLKEAERAMRFEHSLSLLMIDIDDFKKINDTHGHLAGDQVLREVSGVLRHVLRSVDESARYGGEEFVVLLPETTGEEATKLAERLRQRVGRLRIHYKQATLKLTISVGVAEITCPPSSDKPVQELLLDLADKAMYQAKHEGKNKTVLIRESDVEPGASVEPGFQGKSQICTETLRSSVEPGTSVGGESADNDSIGE